jgi:hypothetical protein
MNLQEVVNHLNYCLQQFRGGMTVWLNDKKATSEKEIAAFFDVIITDVASGEVHTIH